ncbi:MAG: type IV toxin-antitoxin system AbiEi family antitoxin domain-containing protein [Myxococcota bacterium]|jgi:predicted transcriptional regulator of viral defense system|nr:type IV toxin-antitoxin system AbiEi family antitoxin domain-containing protein [Myxococcota bacterium]
MKKAAKQYGGYGVALLRALAEQGRPTFKTAEAREAARSLGIADSYLSVLLHHLLAAGWIQRVKHGTYALSTGLPGFPEAHPFAIGMALIDPCAVSGWAALNHHGLTEQIPRVTTLTTPRRVVTPAMRGAVRTAPSIWEVAGQKFEIVTVVPAHFFGAEEIWMGDSKVRMFERERALLDCFALPRKFGGLGEGLGILEEHLHDLDVLRFVTHAEQYGKISVAKRVGYALEHMGVATEVVAVLQALPMTGWRPLDPTRPIVGERNKRWGLVENLFSPRKKP